MLKKNMVLNICFTESLYCKATCIKICHIHSVVFVLHLPKSDTRPIIYSQVRRQFKGAFRNSLYCIALTLILYCFYVRLAHLRVHLTQLYARKLGTVENSEPYCTLCESPSSLLIRKKTAAAAI